MKELKKELKTVKISLNVAEKNAAYAEIQRREVETEKASLQQEASGIHGDIIVF